MSYYTIIFQVFLRVIGGLNMIRGFFLFLVFMCKRNIWEMAKRRHPRLIAFICYPFFKLTTEDESSPQGTGGTDYSNRHRLVVLGTKKDCRQNVSHICNDAVESGGIDSEVASRLISTRHKETRV
jgi:hypothetical protein